MGAHSSRDPAVLWRHSPEPPRDDQVKPPYQCAKGEVAAQRHVDYARSFGRIGETSRHWPDRDLDFAHFGIDRVLWIRHL